MTVVKAPVPMALERRRSRSGPAWQTESWTGMANGIVDRHNKPNHGPAWKTVAEKSWIGRWGDL